MSTCSDAPLHCSLLKGQPSQHSTPNGEPGRRPPTKPQWARQERGEAAHLQLLLLLDVERADLLQLLAEHRLKRAPARVCSAGQRPCQHAGALPQTGSVHCASGCGLHCFHRTPLSPANLQDRLASCRADITIPHHSTKAPCTRECATAAPSLNVRTARVDVLLDGALAGFVVQVEGAPAPRGLERKSLAKLHARPPPASTTTPAFRQRGPPGSYGAKEKKQCQAQLPLTLGSCSRAGPSQ